MFCASVDLPVPFGPTNTTLLLSVRKLSESSASMAARSIRLGQVQSKSHNGLKRPICAACKRRSRLRWVRSCSSHPSRVSTQPASVASDQCASRPCKRSDWARARRCSKLVIVGVPQLVIGIELVRSNRRVATPDMFGQHDRDWRLLLPLLAATLEREAYCVGMRHVLCQSLVDGCLQLSGAIAIQEPQQGSGDGAEIATSLRGGAQQYLARRRRVGQAIGRTVL